MKRIYGLLRICTDDDFVVVYKDEKHASYDMRFGVFHDELPNIQLVGHKTEDAQDWLREIHENPLQPFSANGNHIVEWTPEPRTVNYLLYLTVENAQKLEAYLEENRVDVDTLFNGFIRRLL